MPRARSAYRVTFFGFLGLFSLSLALGLAVISCARQFNLGADPVTGVQRFHSHWVPRLGGIQIFVALAAWILLAARDVQPQVAALWVVSLLPAFAAGVIEDLTHKVGSWPRLIATMFGALIASQLIDVHVQRLGLPLVDAWLAASPLLCLGVTALFIGGGSHAINMIDGYNGLASSYGMVVLTAILIAAGRVNDVWLMHLSAGGIAATFGFFVLNFPYGRIFLGDSGAYLLGTLIGFELAYLVARHSEISPMFAAVLLVYPVWELLFSSYRRRVLRGRPAMQPDAIHLHTLIHKRLVRSHFAKVTGRRKILMNSATTFYPLAMTTATAVLALTFWTNTGALFGVFLLFITTYLSIYFSLVRFRAQKPLSMQPVWSNSKVSAPVIAVKAAKATNHPTPNQMPAYDEGP